MKQYLDALQFVLDNGVESDDRTGIGTLSVVGYQMRFDLSQGFPAVTTKRLAWKSVVSELLWFLEGSRNERRLAEILYEDEAINLIDKKTIWTANADKQGSDLYPEKQSEIYKELGPIYGNQWRGWGWGNVNELDQISNLVKSLKENPESRRHILSAWNVEDIDRMALPPCHVMSQFFVKNGKLSCVMYQRSADAFLGVPFNIASYALLTHILAKVCNLEVGEFIHMIGDLHIYKNHIEQVKEQLVRIPDKLPKLVIHDADGINETLTNLRMNQFSLEDYNPQPTIKAEMAV